ncbi:MAG: ACT domain-containing protein [Rhodopseudomonas palustris]|nr:ACT domain-containing protein [Rhodopseudomonas palustris]
MRSRTPASRAQMFQALADEGINIRAITTSEIKFSVLIDAAYTELAVRTLHAVWFGPGHRLRPHQQHQRCAPSPAVGAAGGWGFALAGAGVGSSRCIRPGHAARPTPPFARKSVVALAARQKPDAYPTPMIFPTGPATGVTAPLSLGQAVLPTETWLSC